MLTRNLYNAVINIKITALSKNYDAARSLVRKVASKIREQSRKTKRGFGIPNFSLSCAISSLRKAENYEGQYDANLVVTILVEEATIHKAELFTGSSSKRIKEEARKHKKELGFTLVCKVASVSHIKRLI
jgi:hypothetical protein